MLWLIISIAGAFFLKSALESHSATKNQKIFIPPPQELKYFTFGYSQALADSLWLRWIQDIDACGKGLENREQVLNEDSDTNGELKPAPKTADTIEPVKGSDSYSLNSFNDFKEMNSKIPACKKGWSFLMLDIMTELDPKMHLAYALGAPTLSILAHDPLGAEVIFNKGLKAFPEDWALFYRAGYHAQFELYQPEKAAERFNRAVELGAPDWLKSLAARLYTQSGQFDLAISVLEGYKRGITDVVALQKIDERITELKKRLNLRISQ